MYWYSVSQNRASNKYFFATFHRLSFIHSPKTRGFMIMEEEVDGPSREKGSMMNYTKKPKPIGSNPLQHSTRSYLKLISWDEKRNLAGESGIACWSRIGNEHTDALMNLMTPTQMMMITTLWTIPTTLQAISQISLLHQWCTITLAMCITI